MPRFDEKCADKRALRRLFEANTLTGNKTASEVRAMNEAFEPFKMPQFKNAYYKLRREYFPNGTKFR